jgi:hypothetical protein
MALIAVGSENRQGIDIEKVRVDVDTAALAERDSSRFANARRKLRRCRIISACRVSLPAGRVRKPS